MSGTPGKPMRVGEALARYLRESGLAERVEQARVVPEWNDHVGETIAGVTTPLRVSNGVLFVAVRSSAWLTELKMMERRILRRLNTVEGRPEVREIRFIMSRD